MRQRILAACTVWAAAAQAHEGHGMTGSHWHAGDAIGSLVLGAACLILGLWLTRRK